MTDPKPIDAPEAPEDDTPEPANDVIEERPAPDEAPAGVEPDA